MEDEFPGSGRRKSESGPSIGEYRFGLIYTLSDPRTGRVRYVGKTCQRPTRRLGHHVSTARHRRNHRERWIASLGVAPTLTVVEQVTGSVVDVAEVERRWIARLRSDGCHLTNLTTGGEGTPGRKASAETRAKMSASLMGNQCARGCKRSPATRSLLSAQKIGNKHSLGLKRRPETLARMSAALMGNQNARGRVCSPETRAKIGAANRRRAASWVSR